MKTAMSVLKVGFSCSRQDCFSSKGCWSCLPPSTLILSGCAQLRVNPLSHPPSPQLLKQPPKTHPVKHLPLVQHAPDFFHQRRANHLHCFLAEISCRQEPLERLPRLGRITGTYLVLDHLQDRRLQVRIEWRFLIIRLVDSSYFSPSLTRFPLAKRSTRDTILPLCHACHPAPDATFAPLYYTNNKSPVAIVSPPPYDLGPCRRTH